MKSRIRELANNCLFCLIILFGFAACQQDEPERQEPQNAPKTYTLTVEATKGSENDTAASSPVRKVLGLDDKTLNATWAEGEKVTVYNVTRSADLGGYLEAQSSGASTTLKGDLTGTIMDDDELKLKFLSPSYSTQDGTLTGSATSIDKVCDYAEATVTVTDASTSSVTTTDATFLNQQAIVKFTLKDIATGNPAINATKLTVTAGETTITVTPSSASSELYVAIPGISGQTVDLSANVGYYIYTCNKTGVTFANSQYYEITVKMTKHAVNLASITSNFTAANGDVLTGTLGSNVQISIADGATITLEDATINRTSSSYPGLTCLGSATINLMGENTTNGGSQTAGILIGGTGTTLIINGPGSLSTTGGSMSAGIGLSRYWGTSYTGGNIVINGGTITARSSGNFTSGIGTGCVGSSSSVIMGDITINGGTVFAYGSQAGAGIGTGFCYPSCTNRVGNITITGGTVGVTGGTNDATNPGGTAIGAGPSNYANSTNEVGNITISGGTVTATCGTYAVSTIGKSSANSVCGVIEFTTTPTITLNNPNNGGSSVSLRSFVDTGNNIKFSNNIFTPGSTISLTVGNWVTILDYIKFGCPESAGQFIYRPKN